MSNIGPVIKELRVSRRLTQEQMERRTGIKREYLSKIETGGLPNITLKTLVKITDALDISLSSFFRNTH